MSGRMEHDRATMAKAYRLLEGKPPILTKFFEEGSGKQMSCKYTWTCRAINFYDWATESRGYNLTEETGWGQITRDDIKDFFRFAKIKIPASESKDGAPVYMAISSMGTVYTIIKNFFKFLVLENVIRESPVPTKSEIEKIIGQENNIFHPVAMTPAEVNTVRESISVNSKYPARDVCIFVLGCRTGLRATALSEIDISDIDFEEGILHAYDKGNREREIYLDSDTTNLIRKCIEEREVIIARCKDEAKKSCDALFIGYYNGAKRISVSHIRKLIDTNTQMLNKHITPHKMRSTCVTTTYKMTNSIYDAAEQVGHRNINNTMRYIDNRSEKRKRAERLAQMY